ncbi:GntR family transcriptional regulator [uncultured Draconibacterium sp.]|uniref:GntR family transcriptional regulator n=1 Tax=uncultured Draconibacterium sp. TaxID=1573823 RepID=UPI0032601152
MKIKHTDLSFEVYKRLKTMILANEFEPGEKLVQEQIAAMFGVSRMPLHKAFQMLENEMLVENLPRRGFYVTEIDNAKLLDAFECREALEGIAARRTAQIISARELEDLNALFKPFVGKKKIDFKKYIEADQAFHNAVLQISGNQILQKFEVVKNITSQTYRGGLIREPEETLPEHLAIIAAIASKDAVLAEKLMRQHSVKTQELIRKKIKNE